MLRIILNLTAALLASPAAYAMPQNYSIISPQTTIVLAWQAFGGISQAHFDGVTGSVLLDAGNDLHDSVKVNIPTTTLVASNSLLTYQLKSDLFFDTARYPTLSFTSTRVVAQGQGRYRIFGLLQVKNIQRPVVLHAATDDDSSLTSGKNIVSLRATTVISRAAFNMDKLEALVDDNIAIEIKIRARLEPSS